MKFFWCVLLKTGLEWKLGSLLWRQIAIHLKSVALFWDSIASLYISMKNFLENFNVR